MMKDEKQETIDLTIEDEERGEDEEPLKKKKKGKKRKLAATECPICLEVCNSVGSHQLISLKCGHLYGRSCLEKWFKDKKTCPSCNGAIRKSDIRPLFTNCIATVDNSREESWKNQCEQLKKKNILLEAQLAKSALRYRILQEEQLAKSKRIHDLLETISSLQNQKCASCCNSTHPDELKNLTDNNSFNESHTENSPYKTSYKKIASLKIKESRVFSISSQCDLLCIGDRSVKPTSGSEAFGILKASVLDFQHKDFIPVHAKPVRDIDLSPLSNDLVVSTSFDNTVKVTNLSSNSIVLKFSLMYPGWTCKWDPEDINYMYCGQQNGVVSVFDIRQTREALGSYSGPQKQPIHSICLLKSKGALIASFGGLNLYPNLKSNCHETVNSEKIAVPPLLESPCMSLVNCHNLVVASTRNYPAVHVVSDMNSTSQPNVTLKGHRCPSVLSRPCIWKEENGLYYVASGDENTKSVVIWDVKTQQIQRRIPSPNDQNTIVDIKHASCSKSTILGTLSAEVLSLYNCTSN